MTTSCAVVGCGLARGLNEGKMTGRPTPPGAAHDPVDLAGQGIRRHPKLGKQVGRGSLVPQERAQQMLGSDPRVSASPSPSCAVTITRRVSMWKLSNTGPA